MARISTMSLTVMHGSTDAQKFLKVPVTCQDTVF